MCKTVSMNRATLLTLGIAVSWFGRPFFAVLQDDFLGKTAEAWSKQLKESKDAKVPPQCRLCPRQNGRQGRDRPAGDEVGPATRVRGRRPLAIVFAMGDICRDPSQQNNSELEELFLDFFA